ncbi:hypothetical protein WJX75_009703 [Coccomyxa subellipsoidea]|uniref:ARM repeat-containing protein n=1 Tax=Coccomyxa subellipsoidea TaxID=248742 RepID=A0ABR2YB79_9CHLO
MRWQDVYFDHSDDDPFPKMLEEEPENLLGPYVATEVGLVEKALQFAEVRPSDRVLDLGSDRHLVAPHGASLLQSSAAANTDCIGGGRSAIHTSAACLAQSTAGPSSEEADEGAVGRLVRLLLIGTIAAVALKLAPSIGAGNVIGAVRLLEADTSLMQRSGADRVRLLAKSGWADEILLREGAPAKLLALLSKSADQSVMVAALKALDALCAQYDGREALVLAGAVDRLQEALNGSWIYSEDGREVLTQLLVALKIQQNDVE